MNNTSGLWNVAEYATPSIPHDFNPNRIIMKVISWIGCLTLFNNNVSPFLPSSVIALWDKETTVREGYA
ncbi:hypothetical protein T12_2955 [Trichinella patagoniensis]|uniref:Uncharacterized protein n=1 Tax=Trichinella patagoniensis TaxID=990121 RepID=A0A0V0ZMF9_9BILA|nr:hypothetical protein T12_2955 [Trichinella patagoniensis]